MHVANASDGKSSRSDLPRAVGSRLAELRTLRGELRLQLNLAGKEARDRWRELEARVRAAEADVRGAPRNVGNLAKLIQEVRRFRNRLMERAAPILPIC